MIRELRTCSHTGSQEWRIMGVSLAGIYRAGAKEKETGEKFYVLSKGEPSEAHIPLG